MTFPDRLMVKQGKAGPPARLRRRNLIVFLDAFKAGLRGRARPDVGLTGEEQFA
jgi:hypothetical protein